LNKTYSYIHVNLVVNYYKLIIKSKIYEYNQQVTTKLQLNGSSKSLETPIVTQNNYYKLVTNSQYSLVFLKNKV